MSEEKRYKEGDILVNKLKILRNPRKKSGKQLVKDLVKPGYEVSMEQKGVDGDVIVRIDKRGVKMSLPPDREN